MWFKKQLAHPNVLTSHLGNGMWSCVSSRKAKADVSLLGRRAIR